MKDASRSSRGTTLIEVLIGLGIITVLVGIFLPTLSHARQSAIKAQCMVEMRQLATRISIYSSNNNDYVPFAYTRDRASGQWKIPNGTLIPDDFFSTAADFWTYPMLEEFGNSFTNAQLLCPNDTVSIEVAEWASGKSGVLVSQVGVPLVRSISRSFYYSPSSLREDAVPYNQNQNRVAKLSEVTFPSGKAFLVEDQPFHDEFYVGEEFVVHAEMPFRRMVVAVDLSTRLRSVGDANPAVLIELSPPPGAPDPELYLRTQRLLAAFHFSKDGVLGRDW